MSNSFDPGSSIFADKTIEQVVAFLGNGKLVDNSKCSEEFRLFLEKSSYAKLASYANFCLDNKFERSGSVLQDVVNEIGRRLGFNVTNGRYQGVKDQIGHDGLWADSASFLVVEVKTTDAYRINLDTICAYGEKLKNTDIARNWVINTLIIVGRQDTGDLEAQVRGSRHAWSVRIISIASLIKIMYLYNELDDPILLNRIKNILKPIEYTRVDNIVDILFDTQKESDSELSPRVLDVDGALIGRSDVSDVSPIESTKPEMEKKRFLIVESFFQSKKMKFLRKSKTNFSDILSKTRVTCAVSKKYEMDSQIYWYALHPKWIEFLKSGEDSFFILGCMDREKAYAIPLSLILENVNSLNRTERGDKSYWHITLSLDQGILNWNVSQKRLKIDLTEYEFVLGQ